MRTIMFEVRWAQRDWTTLEQEEVVTHHKSGRFISVRSEDARKAAVAFKNKMRLDARRLDDEQNITVEMLRVVRITEELV